MRGRTASAGWERTKNPFTLAAQVNPMGRFVLTQSTLSHMSVSPHQRAPHRVIAFYLPQFYPIPENDRWWGKGYTEWAAVARARPMFPGHRQPRIPTELGYYDLRVPEIRVAQAELARAHGVEGFCYWHYWMGNGKRLLERPFEEVVRSGVPAFPFCLAWANHDWFDKSSRGWKLLIRQEYPGNRDEVEHFRSIEAAFHDPRYIKVDGRPVFLIFSPDLIPSPKQFTDHWRALAEQSGLPGLFLIGRSPRSDLNTERYGLDAIQPGQLFPFADRARLKGERFRPNFVLSSANHWASRRLQLPELQSYRKWAPFIPHVSQSGYSFPVAYSNWDSTPRWGRRGTVMLGENSQIFEEQLERAFGLVAHRTADHRLIFLKSWNEWAEGNYLEPDLHSGRAFLEALRSAVERSPGIPPLLSTGR